MINNKSDWQIERCRDCVYLFEGDNGEWLCDNCDYEEDIAEIHQIKYCYVEDLEEEN